MTERTIRLNVITNHIGSTWQTGRGDQETVCGVVLVTACRGTAGTRSLIRGIGRRVVHGDDAITVITGFASVSIPIVGAAGKGVIGRADGVAIATGVSQAPRSTVTRAAGFVARLVMDNTGVPGVAKGPVAVVALGTVVVLGGVTPEVAPGVARTVTSIGAAIVTRIGGGAIITKTDRTSNGDGLSSGRPDTIGVS